MSEDSELESKDSQQAAGGGAGDIPIPGGGVQPSLIQSIAPPVGRDPRSHHTDTAANLLAVQQTLLSTALEPPKILSPKTVPSMAPAGVNVGSGNPPSTSTTHASNLFGVGSDGSSGVTEIKTNLVTTKYLAAAALKFYNSTAEDVVEMIKPIVPFFAACRTRWVEKQFSGAYLVPTKSNKFEALNNKLF